MTQPITIHLPEHLNSLAQLEADRTAKPLELVLIDWLEKGGKETLDCLNDAEILTLCDSQMDEATAEQFRELQSRNRESELDVASRQRLQELMSQYQIGLLRKAQAWKVAVGRGLKSGLN